MEIPSPCGVVSLLTDFGVEDPCVGVMQGMILRRHPRATVVDLCHGVPPFDIELGAFAWSTALTRFPPGTVHVGVVDPGVGTGRRILAACGGECFWLAPDNGLLEGVWRRTELEVRAVDLAKLRLPPSSSTFHGRDVFAPVAGMLAGGKFGFRALGPIVEDAVRLDLPALVAGAPPQVLRVDNFGNLITNVDARRLTEERWRGVVVGRRQVRLRRTYGEAEVGEVLALVNSYDLLEIAVCQGRADEELGLGPGDSIEPWRE